MPLARKFIYVMPLVLFIEGEQAVVTCKFMRSLWHKVREPSNLESNDLAGTAFLGFIDDAQIVRLLATEWYNLQKGTSSLPRVVTHETGAKPVGA